MRLDELLFSQLGYDERCLILDRLSLRDAQVLSCANTNFRRRLSPAQLNLLSVDLDAYSWANRQLLLPPPEHGGIALAMRLPAAAAAARVDVLHRAAAQVPTRVLVDDVWP